MSATEARARLEDGEIGSFYLIPASFEEDGEVTRIEPGGFDISSLESSESNTALLRYVIRQAQLEEAGLSPEDAEAILRGVSVTVVSVGARVPYAPLFPGGLPFFGFTDMTLSAHLEQVWIGS